MNAEPGPGRAGPPAGAEVGRWLPTPALRPAASLRLFGFPYAGGGVPVFRSWPDLLPASIEMRVVQLPGRGPRLREPCFTDLPALVEILADVIAPLLDRPFAFFGHSVGTVVAFETARRLAQRGGQVPGHLFFSGNNAPHLPNPTPHLHDLPDGAFLGEVTKLNGMPPAVLASPELLELMLPVVRADLTLLEGYHYREAPLPFSCPITVFGGQSDPRTTREGLEAWRAHTTGSFDLRLVPGDHFFVDTARADVVSTIVEKLGVRGGGGAGGGPAQ